MPDHLTIAIANCRACLLSDAMKDCPRCAFYPALPIKALKALEVPYPEELRSKTLKALTEKLSEEIKP